MSITSRTLAPVATILAVALLGATAGNAATRHPPGPDHCWTLQKKKWVWTCGQRGDGATMVLPDAVTVSPYADPGYLDRNYSDPGYYDPSYYNTVPLFMFDWGPGGIVAEPNF
jgi:hypothetical protein